MTNTLDTHVQIVSQGVIINSNVFLWDAQWHTMVMVDDQMLRCAVCQVNCYRSACEEHIKTSSHLHNLNSHQPLEKYDLSIVRKINTMSHCGVCNDIIKTEDYEIHENTKKHEENLLTAVNKVSDLMYDGYTDVTLDHTKAIAYNIDDFIRHIPNDDTNVSRDDSCSGTAANNDGEYHFEANDNRVCIYNVYDDIEGGIVEEYGTEELEEYSPPLEGISYASMARRPSVAVPKFMIIDLGTRKLRMMFESWHMVVKLGSNIYYCMACNVKDLIRFQTRHCLTCDHIERLTRCDVIRVLDDNLIRKVSDRLFHCSYCNVLQCLDQVEDHIEGSHPKKNRNYVVEDTDISLKKKKKTVARNTVAIKNVLHKTEREEPDTIAHNIDPNFDIFGHIHLSPFGSMLRIPALNFNLIKQVETEYYCFLCNKICEDVKRHVEDSEHVSFMNMAPYIQNFKDNLTRAVREHFHCSLCNDLIMITEIYNHNMDRKHTDALAIAMGIKQSHRLDEASRKISKSTRNVASNKQSPLNTSAKPSVDVDDLTQMSNASCGQTSQHILSDNVLKSSLTNDLTASNITTGGISAQNDAHMLVAAILQYTHGELPVTVVSDDGQNLQHFQNISIPAAAEVNLPPAKDLSNSGHPPKPIESFPPTFYSTFPSVPPVNNQHINQPFLEEPLSPFSDLPLNNNPSLLSHNDQKLTLKDLHYSLEQEMERKILIITDTVKSSDDHTECGTDQFRRDSENSKTGNNQSRRDSENSKTGTNQSRRDSENSKTGNNQSRRDSANSKTVNDQMSRNSGDRKNVIDNIVIGDQSEEEDFKEFDYDEMVLVKFKTTYMKITKLAYNTLVFVDNGVRYCFVCSSKVYSHQLQKHVESRGHLESLAGTKFLDKYGVQLFRQMYVKYHCAICNVLMSRKDCKRHLEWPLHVAAHDAAHLRLNKRNRKHLKSGLKEYSVETQKETIILNVKELTHRVRAAYSVVRDLDTNDAVETVPIDGVERVGAPDRKNKMVIQNNVVLKIPFEHWHGITATGAHVKCILCQVELREHEVGAHVESEYHAVSLGITCDNAYAPALIRKINASSVNCMTCNLELPNAEELVAEHLAGRRHHHHDSLVRDTLRSRSYADCYTEYLHV